MKSPVSAYFDAAFSLRHQGQFALLTSTLHLLLYMFVTTVYTNKVGLGIFLFNSIDIHVIVSISILS
jgi:hypothetical protein